VWQRRRATGKWGPSASDHEDEERRGHNGGSDSPTEMPDSERGHLALVGIGRGLWRTSARRALRALGAADIVVGYRAYVDQVRHRLGPKDYRLSELGVEVDRARLALDLARQGKRVALISSGDAGIYGMTGLALELLRMSIETWPEIEIVPGISAAQSAAAVLGAPLMADFAVISLSDLMVPWESSSVGLRRPPWPISWWRSTIHASAPHPTIGERAGDISPTPRPRTRWASFANASAPRRVHHHVLSTCYTTGGMLTIVIMAAPQRSESAASW